MKEDKRFTWSTDMIVTPDEVRFGRGQESTEHFSSPAAEILKCQGRHGELHNSKKLGNSGAR